MTLRVFFYTIVFGIIVQDLFLIGLFFLLLKVSKNINSMIIPWLYHITRENKLVFTHND